MKHNLLSVCLILLGWMYAVVTSAAIPENCDSIRLVRDYPGHYCDCEYNYTTVSGIAGLNDVNFSDSVWFKTSLKTFTNAGMTAYLFSESDVQVDIYQNCRTTKKLYSFTVPKNQTRDLDHETILAKLEQNGVGAGSLNMTIRVVFYPVTGGADCRLMCYPYNTGPNSTMEAPLPLLVGMTYVSSHAYDVYELKAENIPASCLLYTQWTSENDAPCYMYITRGSVDGDVVAEHDFLSATSYYHFDPQLLAQLRVSGESLYLHFDHEETVAGRIITREVKSTDVMTDVTLCQGQKWEYNGQIYTESTQVPYDTVWTSSVAMKVYKYNLIFVSATPQYDTLALPTTELPYLYRNQERVDNYGDYDLTIRHEGECDEHIFLHVKHLLTTITTTEYVALCQGNQYEHTDGKKYNYDVTIVDSVWHNQDTLYLKQVNVYFSEMDVLHDTVALKKKDLPTRLYGQSIEDFGDYACVVTDEGGCQDSLYLHVKHDVRVLHDTTVEQVCEGKSYEHDGVVYTSSVAFSDTVWTDDDTQKITTYQLLFVPNEAVRDTVWLKSADLPYLYRGQDTIASFGDYEMVYYHEGDCNEYIVLSALHKTDTVYQAQDTVLCVGKVYEYNGEYYVEDVTLLEEMWVSEDTLQITTVRVDFVQSEVQFDTLGLKTTDLPYLYRGQDSILVFGNYDVTIRPEGECEERYQLYVYHRVDTLCQVVDSAVCGSTFTYEGVRYNSDQTFTTTVQHNQDTVMVNSLHVYFTTEVQEVYESLGLKKADLPYTFTWPNYTKEKIHSFGDYVKEYTNFTTWCQERMYLHVYHDVDTVYTQADTALCQGRVYVHGGVEYVEPVELTDSAWAGDDTWQVSVLRVSFDDPVVEHDTLKVPSVQLIAGYYYEPADTTIYAAGVYYFEVVAYDTCTRNIELTVYEDCATAVDGVLIDERPRLVMRDGRVVVIRDKECYTLLGERVN